MSRRGARDDVSYGKIPEEGHRARDGAMNSLAKNAKLWSWAGVVLLLLAGTGVVLKATENDGKYTVPEGASLSGHPQKADVAAQAGPSHPKGLEVAHNPVFHKEVETKLRINFETRPDEAQEAALKAALLREMGVAEEDVVGWTFEERVKGAAVEEGSAAKAADEAARQKKEVAKPAKKKEANKAANKGRALEGDEEEIDIDALFDALDTSGDGSLTREEVVSGAYLVGMTEDEAAALFDTLDEDGSGEISRDELRKGAGHIGKAGVDYEITLLVKMPDKESAEVLKQNTAALFTDMTAKCAQLGGVVGLKTKGCKAVVQRIVDDDWDDDWLYGTGTGASKRADALGNATQAVPSFAPTAYFDTCRDKDKAVKRATASTCNDLKEQGYCGMIFCPTCPFAHSCDKSCGMCPTPAPTWTPSSAPTTETRAPFPAPTGMPVSAPSATPSAVPFPAPTMTPAPTPLTKAPIPAPTKIPIPAPTGQPTFPPTHSPTTTPAPTPLTKAPIPAPTKIPIPAPTGQPTFPPTHSPTTTPAPTPLTKAPIPAPTKIPIPAPTGQPTFPPTHSPTTTPAPTPLTKAPIPAPTKIPIPAPTGQPTFPPTHSPTTTPAPTPLTKAPIPAPTKIPIPAPTGQPTFPPTHSPTTTPAPTPLTKAPIPAPTKIPIPAPTGQPTFPPTHSPTTTPAPTPLTKAPSPSPTLPPTNVPTSPTPVPALRPTPYPSMAPVPAPTNGCQDADAMVLHSTGKTCPEFHAMHEGHCTTVFCPTCPFGGFCDLSCGWCLNAAGEYRPDPDGIVRPPPDAEMIAAAGGEAAGGTPEVISVEEVDERK